MYWYFAILLTLFYLNTLVVHVFNFPSLQLQIKIQYLVLLNVLFNRFVDICSMYFIASMHLRKRLNLHLKLLYFLDKSMVNSIYFIVKAVCLSSKYILLGTH